MQKLNTDLLIIGSGAGGLAAALTAAEGGAKVIVFEKNRFAGGISNFPKEIFAVESALQQQLNIPLSKDEAFRIFMERTQWKADARLVRAFIDKSASTIDWLEKLGVRFEIHPHFVFSESQLTAHSVQLPGGFVTLMKILRTKAEQMGVEIRLSTPVKTLIKDENKIIGAIAEDGSGDQINVDARAVVIASGGYPNNAEMVRKYNRLEMGQEFLLLTNIELYGDGIAMAWEAGADSDGMNLAFRYGLPSQSLKPSAWDIFMVTHQPYLWVNCKGQRFFNEGISGIGEYTVNALLRQTGKYAFLIFDNDTKAFLDIEPGAYFERPDVKSTSKVDTLVERYLDNGKNEVFRANTIKEISNCAGINPDVLQNTIDEYNGFCDKGHDDQFAKDSRYLRPVKKPPFYAFKIIPIAYGTVGGIKINERAEVVDVEGDAIPGLYAAGDCANGAISHSFWLAFGLRGNPSSFALNTGRIAGENALRYLEE